MTEDQNALDARRRRLIWRATHRGMKEIDLILGTYARREAAAMDESAIGAFEGLLDATDADLYDCLVRCLTPPPGVASELIDTLRRIRFETDSYGNL